MTPRPNNRRRILTAGAAITLLCVAALCAIVFTSCTSNKYIAAAGLPDPDSGYQTGSVYGYDVWIWDCHQGKRVVLWRTSAEMSVGQYTRQETTCGGQTPIELQLANEKKRERDPAAFW